MKLLHTRNIKRRKGKFVTRGSWQDKTLVYTKRRCRIHFILVWLCAITQNTMERIWALLTINSRAQYTIYMTF
jgi:hypothetical protein